LLVAAVLAVPGLAAPFVVPIDPGQSVLNFELCISGKCDTDSSSVSGTVTIDLDSIENPAQIWLHDFYLRLDHNLHWYISWGILGSFTADATNVAVYYAYPGTPMGPVPIAGHNFTFNDVPTNAEGTLTYHATGVPCIALQGAGVPCDDSQNLADQGTQTADQFSGTVTSQGRVVTLATSIDMTVPLVPEYPTLATLHVYGTVRGQVYVPPVILPGDLNCDGVVGFGDINPFVLLLSNPGAWQTQYPGCPIENGDINGNGSVGFDDINPFVALLSGGP
jgi:hypothetical protein